MHCYFKLYVCLVSSNSAPVKVVEKAPANVAPPNDKVTFVDEKLSTSDASASSAPPKKPLITAKVKGTTLTLYR